MVFKLLINVSIQSLLQITVVNKSRLLMKATMPKLIEFCNLKFSASVLNR